MRILTKIDGRLLNDRWVLQLWKFVFVYWVVIIKMDFTFYAMIVLIVYSFILGTILNNKFELEEFFVSKM